MEEVREGGIVRVSSTEDWGSFLMVEVASSAEAVDWRRVGDDSLLVLRCVNRDG